MGNKNKIFSGETEGNGEWGMEKWESPPEKVWWPPVLLIFYSDFKLHKDIIRRDEFLTRMSGIKDKHGNQHINNPNSGLYWSSRLLW